MEQLSNFEHDMMMMIKNLEFRKVKNEFQQKCRHKGNLK